MVTTLTIPLKSFLIKFLLQPVKIAPKTRFGSFGNLFISEIHSAHQTPNHMNKCEGEGRFHEAVDFAKLESCALLPCLHFCSECMLRAGVALPLGGLLQLIRPTLWCTFLCLPRFPCFISTSSSVFSFPPFWVKC